MSRQIVWQANCNMCHFSTIPTHLGEVALDELVGLLLQRLAAVLFGEAGDADGVGGVQLALEEGAARVHNVRHLEHGGGGQQRAHGHLGHPDVARVHEVDHPPQGRWTDLGGQRERL